MIQLSDSGKKLNVIHIGGGGLFGPIGALFPIGPDLHLTVIEANLEGATWERYKRRAEAQSQQLDITLDIVPACISDRIGKATFHTNVDVRSSSLYSIAASAIGMRRVSGNNVSQLVWKDSCCTVKRVEIDTTTLDALYRIGSIPFPNLLSMDIQGAEYDALVSARDLLGDGSLFCVISEMEFRELYEGQRLFHDIHRLLADEGFVLGGFLSAENWYTGQILDRGFLTVVEAIYLRDYRLVPSFYDLMKLALVSYRFRFCSYMLEIIEYAAKEYPEQWKAFRVDSDIGYNQTLLTMHTWAVEQVKLPFELRTPPPPFKR